MIDFSQIIIIFLVLIFSTIPLHLAVFIVGGNTNFIGSLYVMIIVGIISSLLSFYFPFGNYIAIFILIWIYHEIFQISWFKAVLTWIFQFILIFIITLALEIFGFISYSNFFNTSLLF